MKNRPFLSRLQVAIRGLFIGWSERSFRFHSLATLSVVLFLCYFRPQPIWWAIFLLTCGLVLGLELLNTALEKALDRLHPGTHPTIGMAKDCAAGAILVVSLVSLLVFAAFCVEHF